MGREIVQGEVIAIKKTLLDSLGETSRLSDREQEGQQQDYEGPGDAAKDADVLQGS